MCIKKSTCGKMAVPLKEPHSQFHPYSMYCLYLKLQKHTLQWIINYIKSIDTLHNIPLSNESFQNYKH